LQCGAELLERVWPNTVQLLDLIPAEFGQLLETLDASFRERSSRRLC
jgi:hypothetical protein